MSFLQQQLFQFQAKIRSVNVTAWTDVSKLPSSAEWKKRVGIPVTRMRTNTRRKSIYFLHAIKKIGVSAAMDDYERRKLGIFNQLNFFQLLTGLCIPLVGFFYDKKFPESAWLVASMPAFISVVVLILNAWRKYEVGIIFYFICYPVVTSMVYMSGIHMGVELFFILYGILSVFFLQQISHMLFSVSLSMISYFMLAVIWSDHRFQLESSSMLLYLFNELAGIVFIFYGLFLIKKENLGYQARILAKNKKIAENAVLLSRQTAELTELNSVKNKLFSIIAHDLKTPMYSLRNVFRTIQQQDVPPRKIKAMLPDMVNNLNYTTGLLENLLQWAKCQMQSEAVKIQTLDITKMIADTVQLLHLQATAKQLTIEISTDSNALVLADKDMVDLVLRNLLSNAIKFTPDKGTITIGANEMRSCVEIFVTDTGKGITPEAMQKINRNDYFSTNGTAHEPGTGLGLMICKEFLQKNNSQLHIESEPGTGSTFSFSLSAP